MHLYKFFYAVLYIARAAIVKIRSCSQKVARNEQFVHSKSRRASKFSKVSLGLFCAPEGM